MIMIIIGKGQFATELQLAAPLIGKTPETQHRGFNHNHRLIAQFIYRHVGCLTLSSYFFPVEKT